MITPTELANATGISVSFASQVLSGNRQPSMAMALALYTKTGLRFGPLKGLSAEAIGELVQNQDKAA